MKTRFAILYMGQEKQLFSVREGADGSLYIFQNVGSTTFGGDGVIPVSNQKIAIHSKQIHQGRPANKIKFYVKAKNGDSYDKSVIVKDDQKSGFLFPIVNVLESSFPENEYNLEEKANDVVIRLFGYIGAWETLTYTMYAHDSYVVMPQVQGFTKVTTSFSELSLTIYFSFLHVPDAYFSLNLIHIRGGLRKNAQMVEPNPPLINRMSVDGIERFLQRTHREAADALFQSMERGMRERGIRFRHPGYPFHRWPERSDQRHEDYGDYSKKKSEIYQAPRTIDGILKTPDMLRHERERMKNSMRYIVQNAPKAEKR